jgi:hypothetical protein
MDEPPISADELTALVDSSAADFAANALISVGEARRIITDAMAAYPGRTDETEQAFEETSMSRDPRHPDFALGTIPTGNGTEVRELDPVCCHHGHPLRPGVSTRGWQPCGSDNHRGHRTWHCGHPADEGDGQRCGDVVQWPPASDACTPVGGYGTGGGT